MAEQLPSVLASGGGAELELELLAVLVAVALLLLLAYRIRIPYPLLLVVGGGLLGFLPGIPEVTLDPDLVLVIFLPPLLYAAAFFSSLRDLRANIRPIGLLAIGLVVTTTLIVGVVAHMVIDDLSWAAAFTLGAILSPTDPVAATAIASRAGAPRRFVTVVEGEALVNDASGLVAYKVAAAAVLTGSFSALDAGLEFVLAAAGGVAIGIAVGWVIAKVRKPLDDAPTEIAISLMTPFFAYLPAEAVGASAALAAVTSGIWLGWRAPALITPTTRLQAYGFWELFVFTLNAGLFMLVGLQLPGILERISDDYATTTLAGYALVVAVAVIAVRFVWVWVATYLPRWVSARVREHDPLPPRSHTLLVSWIGMRGAVSLAAALALPLTIDSGDPFPARDLIIFLTYTTILITLLTQGLSLEPLIRRLGIEDDSDHEMYEAKARLKASKQAIRAIDELLGEDWVREDSAQRMRAMYEFRLRRFGARFDDGDDGSTEDQSLTWQRLRRLVLDAERAEIVRLRDEGVINDEVMRRIERDLDLDHARLDAPED